MGVSGLKDKNRQEQRLKNLYVGGRRRGTRALSKNEVDGVQEWEKVAKKSVPSCWGDL